MKFLCHFIPCDYQHIMDGIGMYGQIGLYQCSRCKEVSKGGPKNPILFKQKEESRRLAGKTIKISKENLSKEELEELESALKNALDIKCVFIDEEKNSKLERIFR